MSDNRDMIWALKMAVQALDDMAKYHCPVWSIDDYKQASDIIKTGGQVYQMKKLDVKMRKCTECYAIVGWEEEYCTGCGCRIADHHYLVNSNIMWTECEKLQIIVEKSEPTFEPTPQ